MPLCMCPLRLSSLSIISLSMESGRVLLNGFQRMGPCSVCYWIYQHRNGPILCNSHWIHFLMAHTKRLHFLVCLKMRLCPFLPVLHQRITLQSFQLYQHWESGSWDVIGGAWAKSLFSLVKLPRVLGTAKKCWKLMWLFRHMVWWGEMVWKSLSGELEGKTTFPSLLLCPSCRGMKWIDETQRAEVSA